MFHNIVPESTGASSVLPYQEWLEAQYAFTSRFGDPVQMARHVGAKLHVPRRTVPLGTVDYRTSFTPAAIDCTLVPRNEEQVPCAEASLKLLMAGEDHVFDAPTGWGKSVVGSYIACRLGQPTLIVVNKEDLYDAWMDALVNVLKVPRALVGQVQGEVCDFKGKQFVIAMVQSVMKPDRYPAELYKSFGLMILDEVHLMAADCFSEVCWLFPAKHRLGFSATPKRQDGKWPLVEAHVGPVRVKGTMVPMKPKVLVCQTGWTIPTYRDHRTGEVKTLPFAPGRMMTVLKAMAGTQSRNILLCDFIKSAYQSERRCLVLSDLTAHLDRLFQILTSGGIGGQFIGYYVGGMTKVERDINKDKRVILATYKMCETGTNVPQWDTLLMATPRANVEQAVGRVLRQVEGKKQPVIADMVDNHSLFKGYHLSRLKQYYRLGAEVIQL